MISFGLCRTYQSGRKAVVLEGSRWSGANQLQRISLASTRDGFCSALLIRGAGIKHDALRCQRFTTVGLF